MNFREITDPREKIELAIESIRRGIGDIEEIPDVLYDRAPSVYLRDSLQSVGFIHGTVDFLRKTLVLDALNQGELTHQQIADAAGLGVATVRRWAKASKDEKNDN